MLRLDPLPVDVVVNVQAASINIIQRTVHLHFVQTKADCSRYKYTHINFGYTLTRNHKEAEHRDSEGSRMSKKIGGYTEEHLLNVAKDVVQKKTKGSKLLDSEAEARIPKFNSKGKWGGYEGRTYLLILPSVSRLL